MRIKLTTIMLFTFILIFSARVSATELSAEASENTNNAEEVKENKKQKIIIVSSFPSKVTAIFEAAFEKDNPCIDVEVLKKKTTAGINYVEENAVDLFWVSAPDAFEVLKKQNKLQVYKPITVGIPRRISGYPVNEANGYYSGFAAAGYGIMWNTEYLKEHKLRPPKEWIDLTRPEYQGHIALSTPSRSGTTHVIVEAILQLKGWKQGWAMLKAIAANAKIITQKSSGVPKGVIAGDFGIGIVIDHYGLTAIASGAPIEFTFPTSTVFVPASIGLLKDSPKPDLAKKFIDYVLSRDGQKLLLHSDVRRLPVAPYAYIDKPEGFPNPFTAKTIGSQTAFDVQKSRIRYNLVNSLFDVMITYEIENLRAAMISLQQAENIILSSFRTPKGLSAALMKSRDSINYLPIDELITFDPKFTGQFKKKRKKASDIIGGKQGEIEQGWKVKINQYYQSAKEALDARL